MNLYYVFMTGNDREFPNYVDSIWSDKRLAEDRKETLVQREKARAEKCRLAKRFEQAFTQYFPTVEDEIELDII